MTALESPLHLFRAIEGPETQNPVRRAHHQGLKYTGVWLQKLNMLSQFQEPFVTEEAIAVPRFQV